MMEKITALVSADCRSLYQAGCDALQRGDLDAAIDIFNQALESEPGFVLCRETLRKAQFDRSRRRNGFFEKAWAEVREVPALAKAAACLYSRPLKAVHAAEQVLNHVPTNLLAHKILARAALKASLPRTALLSLNFIYPRVSQDINLTLEMAAALAEAGRVREAISLCGRLLKDYPGNKRVPRLLGYFSKMASDETVAAGAKVIQIPPRKPSLSRI